MYWSDIVYAVNDISRMAEVLLEHAAHKKQHFVQHHWLRDKERESFFFSWSQEFGWEYGKGS